MAFKSDAAMIIIATRVNDNKNCEDYSITAFLMSLSMIYEKEFEL